MGSILSHRLNPISLETKLISGPTFWPRTWGHIKFWFYAKLSIRHGNLSCCILEIQNIFLLLIISYYAFPYLLISRFFLKKIENLGQINTTTSVYWTKCSKFSMERRLSPVCLLCGLLGFIPGVWRMLRTRKE